jgi:hypothetical protein
MCTTERFGAAVEPQGPSTTPSNSRTAPLRMTLLRDVLD